MDDSQKNRTMYRFSGYQLPKISLDETGPSYYVLPSHIHPYYRNQPKYWSSPVPIPSRSIGSTYGSGSSVSEINNLNESNSEQATCRKMNQVEQAEQADMMESLKSQKKRKNKLFPLVKI